MVVLEGRSILEKMDAVNYIWCEGPCTFFKSSKSERHPPSTLQANHCHLSKFFQMNKTLNSQFTPVIQLCNVVTYCAQCNMMSDFQHG